MTSENYQIMNYGLGGSILNHRDADDSGRDDPIYSESWCDTLLSQYFSLIGWLIITSGITEVRVWPR